MQTRLACFDKELRDFLIESYPAYPLQTKRTVVKLIEDASIFSSDVSWLDSMPHSVLANIQLFFVQKHLEGHSVPHLDRLKDSTKPLYNAVKEFFAASSTEVQCVSVTHESQNNIEGANEKQEYKERAEVCVQQGSTSPDESVKRAKLESTGNMKILVILCGLPGSGKSKLCEDLAKDNTISDRLVRLCQDEIGKDACERGAHTALNEGVGKIVIIDRTNINRDQRELWIKIAKRYKAKVICVMLDVEKEICVERAMKRSNHSLPSGKVPMVVGKLAKAKQDVREDEGIDILIQTKGPNANVEALERLLPFLKEAG